MHDILDAKYMLDNHNDETQIRKIVQPLEGLLLDYKRVLIKDSAINAICQGAKLMLAGVLRFDADINIGDVVVLMSTKGEAVALGLAEMTSAVMATCNHGMACRLKRVILDRDQYPRKWGKGPRAKLKLKLKEEGKLDKYGRPNENTPKGWNPMTNMLDSEAAPEENPLKRKKSEEKKKEKKKKKKKAKDSSDDDVDMD